MIAIPTISALASPLAVMLVNTGFLQASSPALVVMSNQVRDPRPTSQAPMCPMFWTELLLLRSGVG